MQPLNAQGIRTDPPVSVPIAAAAEPVDPFAAKPAGIGYLPDATPPRLYSVGENGVDDRGVLKMPHDTDKFQRLTALDQIFFLTRPAKPDPK